MEREVKWVIGIVLGIVLLILGSCSVHKIDTNQSYETVLMDKPYFFGKGGIRDDVQRPGSGWYWISTEAIDVPMVPLKYDEKFDDLTTANNNFLDFDSFLTIRVVNSQQLIKNFGTNWYANVISQQYRTIVRNVVRTKSFDDIMTKPEVSEDVENKIRANMDAYLKSRKIQVVLEDLSLGRAKPNPEVLAEMNRTAAEQQRFKTLVETTAAEEQRRLSETKRAAADNAYRQAMSLSVDDFVKLQGVKAYSEACKYKTANCVIMVGGSNTGVTLPSR